MFVRGGTVLFPACLHRFSLSFPQSKDKPIRLTGTCDYLEQPVLAIFAGECANSRAPSAYMRLKEDKFILFQTLPNSTLLCKVCCTSSFSYVQYRGQVFAHLLPDCFLQGGACTNFQVCFGVGGWRMVQGRPIKVVWIWKEVQKKTFKDRSAQLWRGYDPYWVPFLLY